MPDRSPEGRRLRLLAGVVAASALVYPMLLCAVQLVVTQFLDPDLPAVVVWLALGVCCSVGFVAVVRWAASRPVRSPWLLAGLAPPALFELWLVWPLIAG
ncbi:hypothetical protein [Blastococcus sp. SYSU D00695]